MFSDGLKILSLMQRWSSKREMMGDDPPYLAVGTEVSAKYKGAFCEAKVRKIVRSVKCKVAYKHGSGTSIVTDDQIKGTLRAGSVVEVKHSEKKEYVEATILKIQDCSQYTVVFDDGDITTLRRTALCLKSGRHFAESETLDQLPLTHPEHFGNPVIGGRRGRRNRQDDSSDEEGSSKKIKLQKEEKEADIGKVVCVEISEKKKQKDNWFPGLVVAPTAQDTVKINVKEDYLVRSFKDGRYYTVPKKEAASFTREIGQKVDNNTLRTAVEKALLFLDRDELPPHWDRELLFGLNEITDSDSDGAFDSDSSDDEPREEKDHFVAQLYKFMDDRGTPINKGPTINSRDVDLYKLFKVVHKLGGYNRVTNHNQWKTVSHKLGFGQTPTSVNLVKHAYKKFLHSFEDFYRKLGCTMVNHPRGHRSRSRSNRSLIRDKDKAAPSKDKQGEKDIEELKDDPVTEPNKEKDVIKEESKLKDVAEIVKPQRELRKESHRPRIDKVEKRDDSKVLPLASKHLVIDASVINKVIREDKLKHDDREERLKMREIIKLESNSKEDSKSDKDSVQPKVITDVKPEDSEKSLNLKTRREAKEGKKEEKEDDKNKASVEKDVRPKKAFVSNPVDNFTEQSKLKKSRGFFSKITGSKRMKTRPDSKILRMSKSIGLNPARQKRTFSERMKAMVKKFKIKTGVMHLRHKSPPPPETGDSEERKKITNEDCSKGVTSQLTRSRSKDEVSSKVIKMCQEKKTNIPSTTQAVHTDKKQTKKRKDDDKSLSNDETLDQLPNYKSVSVGDKLKVYYGPTHESKVTYEAKVLNLKQEEQETMYLVHYTGWNTRYDEWIKRSRIADNLSWTPGRAKRARHQQVQNAGSSRVQKKTKSVDPSTSSGMPRSTTPSSVTSSSSRTKSPAASGAPRYMRSRAYSRRTSSHTHTDFSESEMEDDYESDDVDTLRVSRNKEVYIDNRLSSDEKDSKEVFMDKMRSRPYRRKGESGGESEETSKDTSGEIISKQKKNKEETDDEKLKGRLDKRKFEDLHKTMPNAEDCRKDTEGNRSDRLRNKRKLLEEKPVSVDDKEFKHQVNAEEHSKQSGEDKQPKLDLKVVYSDNENDVEENECKKKVKRKIEETSNEEDCKELQLTERRRSRRVVIPKKEDLRLSASKDGSLINDQQPKGRDFDLNQIRSELKGINTSNKSSLEMGTSEDTKADLVDYLNIDENVKKETSNLSPEDIYEFKEPEPFEFEVRTKCGDDRSQRRGFGRVAEDCHSNLQGSGEKNINQTKVESSNDIPENKRSPNKPGPSKIEVLEIEEDDSDEDLQESSAEPESELRKSNIFSECERETKNVENYNDNLQLNDEKNIDSCNTANILSVLPEDEIKTELDGDSEEPLVISETESQEELHVSEQQKDGERLSTNIPCQLASGENIQNNTTLSGIKKENKKETKTESFTLNINENEDSGDGEQEDEEGNEIEDDPILSAIKRVQRAFSQSTGDEDSNDIDLLSELPDPTQKKDSECLTIEKENNSSNESSRESNSFLNSDIPGEVGFHLYSPLNEDNLNSNSNLISDCKVINESSSESTDSESNLEVDQGLVDLNVDDSNKHTEKVELIEDITQLTSKIENPCNKEIAEKEIFKEVEEAEESGEENQKDGDVEKEDQPNTPEECQAECSLKIETVHNNTNVEEEEPSKDLIEIKDNTNLDSTDPQKIEIEDDEDKSVINKEEDQEENEESFEEECVDSKSNEDNEKTITETCNVEESESNLESLLCEETIPGSPAPTSSVLADNCVPMSPELPFASTAVYKPSLPPPVNEATPVIENTPPTTPESSLSPISNSPRGERSGSSPIPENDSSKSNRDFSEVDTDGFTPATKIGQFSEDETNFGLGSNIESMKKVNTCEGNETQSIKKRRRSHKMIEENSKRMKTHRSPRHSNMGSESDDDTSENSLDLLSVHSRSPRPSKYNFTVQLDPELDASQRIAVLQHKLSDLRKTYMSVKAELACIDRRRKKLRRREREASVKTSLKPEVTCS